MKFYVYEWFRQDTNEVIYIGKGYKNRYRTKKKNKMFIWYIENFDCDVRIVEYFDNEEEAFEAEAERIQYFKSKGEAICNIKTSKGGGYQKIWNENKKLQMSINNPMKSEYQRKRMTINNPMKNKETAKKVAEFNSKPIIINNIKYNSLKEAGEHFGVRDTTIRWWLINGQTPKKYGYLKCKYDNQQPS